MLKNKKIGGVIMNKKINPHEALREFLEEVNEYNYLEAKDLLMRVPKPSCNSLWKLHRLNNVYIQSLTELLLIIHYPNKLDYQTLIKFYGSFDQNYQDVQNLIKKLLQDIPPNKLDRQALRDNKECCLDTKNLKRLLLMTHFPENLTLDELKDFRKKSRDPEVCAKAAELLSKKGKKSEIRKAFEKYFPL